MTKKSEVTGSHVYIISNVPSAVTFLSRREFATEKLPDGSRQITKTAEAICTIPGTMTLNASKNTPLYRESMLTSIEWEQVLYANQHSHFIKNGNIQAFNTRAEAMDAADKLVFNAYTGMERIDSSKLDPSTTVQHRPTM